MNPNWLLSSSVRHAGRLHKHVWRILSAQRDLLPPGSVSAVESALREMQATCAATRDPKRLAAQMAHLEAVANKWLKPYPHATLRENIEVLLVVLAVFLGIRTFIAQPFKIPTGSMQPTLYGVTSHPDWQARPSEDLRPNPDFEIPNRLARFFSYWISGIAYDHVVCTAEGSIETQTDEPTRFLMFNLWQTFVVGGRTYKVWFPPERMLQRAGLVYPGHQVYARVFKAGEDIIKMRSYAGDHLFVERITYNFRRPHRGEIIVFETKDIPEMSPRDLGQFYIKRLVALGGETVRIGDDRHLYINGERLTKETPHFEKVYSFDPAQPPAESHYSGHVNGRIFQYAGHFTDERTEYPVPPGHYMVMGDNTLNSSDSRVWGSFPEENVIGRSCFVFWPFGWQEGRSSRWGWGTR